MTSSWGGRRYNHYAFTYNGIAMTSSVLRSKRAIETLKQIMRAFTALQQAIMRDRDISNRVTQLEYEVGELKQGMNVVYGIIDEARELEGKKPKVPMGFVGEPKAAYNARRKKKYNHAKKQPYAELRFYLYHNKPTTRSTSIGSAV